MELIFQTRTSLIGHSCPIQRNVNVIISAFNWMKYKYVDKVHCVQVICAKLGNSIPVHTEQATQTHRHTHLTWEIKRISYLPLLRWPSYSPSKKCKRKEMKVNIYFEFVSCVLNFSTSKRQTKPSTLATMASCSIATLNIGLPKLFYLLD